ncbi:nitrite reductase small subunit NirD [Brevibacillus migulae]|uniref:nitrite reductase small subunit NirD n=1 Tax=Brevibacillus migulae TaxID=1644114 RepID=UPI00106E763F|nr:nitrite reductase small subunit NirD [Brevibacillus migulae]
MKQVIVGNLGEIPPASGKVVHIGDQEIVIFRLSTGEYRAVENRCPHKGGPLAEGIISGKFVYCPLHDWKVSLEDGKVQAPDHGCVQTYPIRLRDGMLCIEMVEQLQ